MTLIPRILLSLALVGLLALASPPAVTQAQAQTASNVECDGCAKDVVGPSISKRKKKKKIGGRDIRRRAIGFKHLDDEVYDKILANMMGANRHAFSATINANATRTLLTLGSFAILATCILNSSGDRGIQIFLRSSLNNWLHPNFPGSLLPSSFDLLLFQFFVTVATLNAYQATFADGGLGPTGTVLGLIFLSAAINYQGNACTINGFADGWNPA